MTQSKNPVHCVGFVVFALFWALGIVGTRIFCIATVVGLCRCIGYLVFVCSNALGYSFY
jgi:hypothetical protein